MCVTSNFSPWPPSPMFSRHSFLRTLGSSTPHLIITTRAPEYDIPWTHSSGPTGPRPHLARVQARHQDRHGRHLRRRARVGRAGDRGGGQLPLPEPPGGLRASCGAHGAGRPEGHRVHVCFLPGLRLGDLSLSFTALWPLSCPIPPSHPFSSPSSPSRPHPNPFLAIYRHRRRSSTHR